MLQGWNLIIEVLRHILWSQYQDWASWLKSSPVGLDLGLRKGDMGMGREKSPHVKAAHYRVGSIMAFQQKVISKHFWCSICIIIAPCTWKIDMYLIQAHQCCRCIELIAVVV